MKESRLSQTIKSVAPLTKKNTFVPVVLEGVATHAIHSDGVGTKCGIAYDYWKQNPDKQVWYNLAQDAVVMNIDDLACAGLLDDYIVSCIINRNPKLVSDDIVADIIDGVDKYIKVLRGYGCRITFCGGGNR